MKHMKTERLPLYRDGRVYDAMNRAMTSDLAFYLSEAKAAKGSILELACGTGRLTIPIAQGGVEIVGLDSSPSMLSHARAKAEAANVRVEWVEADCRNFELGRKFALIFLPFNSMQHLHEHSSLEALFRCVRTHLAEKGRLRCARWIEVARPMTRTRRHSARPHIVKVIAPRQFNDLRRNGAANGLAGGKRALRFL